MKSKIQILVNETSFVVYNPEFDVKVDGNKEVWGDKTWKINWGGHGSQNAEYATAYANLILEAVAVAKKLNAGEVVENQLA